MNEKLYPKIKITKINEISLKLKGTALYDLFSISEYNNFSSLNL